GQPGVICKGRLQASLIIGRTRLQFPVFADAMLVSQVDILVEVDVAGARIVEDGTEIRRRDGSVAGTEQTLQRETSITDSGQDRLQVLDGGVSRDSVIRGRVVVLRVEQSLPLGILKNVPERSMSTPRYCLP